VLSSEHPVTIQVVVVSKCFFGNTFLAILHLEIAKNFFAAGSAEQLNSPRNPLSDDYHLWRQTAQNLPLWQHTSTFYRVPCWLLEHLWHVV